MFANKKRFLIITLSLIGLGILSRFIPHLENFTAITAIALVAGIYIGGLYAVIIPVVAVFVSDLFIGFYNPYVLASVYGSFAIIACIGFLIKRFKTFESIVAGSLFSSTLFFITTNYAVWQFGTMYPKTFDGLLLSYGMGVPFFRNMLVGDLFFTLSLVIAFELALSPSFRMKFVYFFPFLRGFFRKIWL